MSCKKTKLAYHREVQVEVGQLLINADSSYTLNDTPHGTVSFFQYDDRVSMQMDMEGFQPNSVLAIHLHHGTCEKPGHHWNAGMEGTQCNTRSLGHAWAKPFIGDIGNISIGYDGKGQLYLETDLWKIGSEDEQDILGKVLILHQNYQDFPEECAPSHIHDHLHANPKIACGTIL